MAGAVIEMLSTRKLVCLVLGLLLTQICFFLIGGLVAPKPSDASEHIMINCVANESTRPVTVSNCHEIKDLYKDAEHVNPNDMVLMTYIPKPHFAMIPWFQYLLALLNVQLTYALKNKYNPNATMLLKVDIYYSGESDFEARKYPGAWKRLTSCEEERKLECVFNHDEDDEGSEGYEYDCDLLHLFQLGSVPHKYYLVNLRLPVNHKSSKIYNAIGTTKELSVIAIRQTGGFTKVWMCLKAALSVIMAFPVIWFWRRIVHLERKPLLLEKAIFSLGISMLFLNLPLELISVFFEAPWMLFFTDLRQGLFYTVLLSFWIIFVGEHMMDIPNRNKLASYKWQLGCIFTCMMALLVFDIAERGMQLVNPCTTVWTHHNAAIALIVLASVAGCIYFLLLLYMVVKVFRVISFRQHAVPSYIKKYKTVVMRFRILMVLSIVTAGLTVAFYVLSQKYDGLLDKGYYEIEVGSAFFTGVYGLWNIYIFLVLSVYAPSHKRIDFQHPMGEHGNNSRQELIELNAAMQNATEITDQTRMLDLTQQKDQQD